MQMHHPLPPSESKCSVVVVGAGMAGLTCAYELAQAGHDVTILEASDRPGGRVRTFRPPNSAGLLAEVGATFLPDNHPLPLHYAAEFGLRLVTFGSPAAPPRLFIDGKPVVAEKGRSLLAPLADVIQSVVKRQGGWPSPIGPAGSWTSFDHMSLADLLRREGVGDVALSLVSLTLFGNFGDGIDTVSALAAVRQFEMQQGRGRSFVIAGGNDQLASAFVERLGDRARFRSEVVGLEQDANGARLRVRGSVGEVDVRADRVVLAVASPVLARLSVSPTWENARIDALRRQRWTPVIRIFLTVEKRFWNPDQAGMLASTDRPTVRWIAGPAPTEERDILTAYVVGRAARELADLAAAERAEWAREQAARVFPEWPDARTAEASSYCWDEDPFAGGGYPWPGLGDDALPEILAAPAGRIHFAGEHTTRRFGWIQGAMESGLRAANEIHASA